MAKNVLVQHGDRIEIGTQADDGRMNAAHLYLRASGEKVVLTSAQALQLAGLLLDTVRDQVTLEEKGRQRR